MSIICWFIRDIQRYIFDKRITHQDFKRKEASIQSTQDGHSQEIPMKIRTLIALILMVSTLFGCSVKLNPPKALSDEVDLKSQNDSIAKIEGRFIFIDPGTRQADLFSVLIAIDDSKPSFVALTSEGAPKTREELFEYEQIEVTSESGNRKITYSIRYKIY